MSGLKLTLKRNPARRLAANGLSTDRLLGLSVLHVEETKLSAQGESVIADWFRVEVVASNAEDAHVRIVGDLSRFDQIAGRQESGKLVIEGDVGHQLGCGMSGGRVIVSGDAGDRVASAAPGSRAGMQGGRIEIQGSVGNELASRMRRGEVFVCGDAGDFAAANMIAGTVLIAGQAGDQLAFGMRRGSLLLSKPSHLFGGSKQRSMKGSQVSGVKHPSGRFTAAIPASTLWMRLIQTPTHLETQQLLRKLITKNSRVSRGDRAVTGQGELIWPA